MEVSEAIVVAREKSESMARLARILSRIKPLIHSTGTTIRLSDASVGFYCMAQEDAMRLANALPGKLELAYQGASTVLYGQVHIQGIDFDFSVPTIRKIRLADCKVRKKRRILSTGWQEARLLFNELEIAKMHYQSHTLRNNLKEKLWEYAILHKADNQRLDRFDFVL